MELKLIGKLDVTSSKCIDTIKKSLSEQGYLFVDMGTFGRISTNAYLNNEYHEIWVFDIPKGNTIGETNCYNDFVSFLENNETFKPYFEKSKEDVISSGNASIRSMIILALENVLEDLKDLKEDK